MNVLTRRYVGTKQFFVEILSNLCFINITFINAVFVYQIVKLNESPQGSKISRLQILHALKARMNLSCFQVFDRMKHISQNHKTLADFDQFDLVDVFYGRKKHIKSSLFNLIVRAIDDDCNLRFLEALPEKLDYSSYTLGNLDDLVSPELGSFRHEFKKLFGQLGVHWNEVQDLISKRSEQSISREKALTIWFNGHLNPMQSEYDRKTMSDAYFKLRGLAARKSRQREYVPKIF